MITPFFAQTGDSLVEVSTPYLAILISAANLLMLLLILVVAYKMHRLAAKMDQISQDAGKFLQMGMMYFKKKP